MEKLLNDAGKELNLLKFKLIKGEIPEDVIPIIVSKYPKKIEELLTNNKLDIKDFTDEIKKIDKYCLSSKEMELLGAEHLAMTYDSEISKSNEKFTVRVVKNTLIVEKFFRISKQYYKNLLGIDLSNLLNEANKSKKSYRYKYFSSKDGKTYEAKKYDTELNKYQEFTKNRFNVVLKSLKNNLLENKIIPMYKTIKVESNRPMRINTSMKDNVATIGLYIDLDTKDDFDKNIKVINKFLNQVNTEIEQHMNYKLYK